MNIPVHDTGPPAAFDHGRKKRHGKYLLRLGSSAANLEKLSATERRSREWVYILRAGARACAYNLRRWSAFMSRQFKVGDHVKWNSEAGHVSGKIIAVHTRDFDYKGHTHHASPDDPQYEIKSDKSDHVAAHKGQALKHISK
jgi:hypothetical protein